MVRDHSKSSSSRRHRGLHWAAAPDVPAAPQRLNLTTLRARLTALEDLEDSAQRTAARALWADVEATVKASGADAALIAVMAIQRGLSARVLRSE